MGLFANLASNPDALAMLAGANGLANFTPTPTTRVPESPAFGLASGLQAAAKAVPQTIAQSQEMTKDAMNLQLQQAAQPGLLDMYKNNPNGANIASDPESLYMRAIYSSPDAKTRAEALEKYGDFKSKVVQMPDGTSVPLSTILRLNQPPVQTNTPYGFPPSPQAATPAPLPTGNPTVAPPASVGMTNLPPMGAPQANSIPPIPPMPAQNPFTQAPPGATPPPPAPGQNPPASPANPLMAADGKLIVPGIQNSAFYPPDPAPNNPKYPYLNNSVGNEDSKKAFAGDWADNKAMTDTITNAEQQTARINDMEEALRSGQAGSLSSQYPEFFNKLIGSGAITDKGTINNVAAYQRVEADQVQEVLAQLKSIIPAGSRINRAEFSALSDKLNSPDERPQAISDSFAMAQGLADYQRDMVKSWNSPAIGGLSNRIGGAGYTMPPSTFQERWQENHDITDYVNQYKATAKPLMGQAGAPKNLVTPSGLKYQVIQ
jgi:hypothetical protein